MHACMLKRREKRKEKKVLHAAPRERWFRFVCLGEH